MTRSLRVGTAIVEITPADLTGLNPMGVSFDQVHDPLFLRALVLDDGSSRAALVSVDLIEVGDTKDVRARIEAATGIRAAAVMIAPSHSHNAPRIGLVPPGGKARIPSPQSLEYTEVVYDAMVEAVASAAASTFPAAVGVGRIDVDVNVNREVNVGGRWDLGYNPDGPSDKTLTVLSVRDADGAVRAVVLNYAVHSTVTLGTEEVSADLAGVAARFVETKLGPDAVALWTAGALGDQAPRAWLEQPTDDRVRDRRYAHGLAEAQGTLVGAAAVRAVRAIGCYDDRAAVTAQERIVDSPARRLEVPPGMEQAQVDTVELTLGCVTIGATAFVGVSGEVTVPVFRSLQAVSPLANTLVVSNANARIGYLPADEAFDRDTQASRGCPIVRGHVESAIVGNLREMVDAAVGGPARGLHA